MSNSDVHQRDANECELWNKISITRLIKLILIFEDFMDIYRPLKIFILKVLLSSSYNAYLFHPRKFIHEIFCLKQIFDNP